jgi:uncharacterized protein involved in outer membrane biogenesis
MKILKIAGVVLGVLIALIVLFLWLADFSGYKPEIEAAVTDATGREFRINGAFSVSVLPSPSVLVEDVTLANAQWADEASMLEAGSMSVSLGLWSLLSGPVVVNDFQLHDVTVIAETSDDGEFNWDIAPDEKPEEASEPDSDGGSGEVPVDIINLEMSNIRAVLRQPDADEKTVVLERLSMVENDSGLRVVDGTGQYLELPFTIAGTVDDADVEVSATLGEVRYQSKTRYTNRAVEFDVTVGTLEQLGLLAETEGLPAEDLSLAGMVRVDGDTVTLNDVLVTVGPASVTLNGDVDSAESSGKLSFSAEAEHLQTFAADMPDLPLAASGEVRFTDSTVSVEPFDLTFGESDLSGALRAESGDTPNLELRARSNLIDVRPFTQEEEATGEAVAEPAESADGDDDRYVFKDEPLPLDALQAANVDVDVEIQRVQTRGASFDDIELLATIKDGTLTLTNSFRGGEGGEFENQVELIAEDSNASLNIMAQAKKLKLGVLSGAEIPTELIPESDVTVDLVGSGSTERELASSLDGRVLFIQGPGRVDNALIGRVSGDVIAQLFSALNPFAEEEEYSNWECTVFAIDFESGLGEISGFLLQDEKIMVVGGGNIDLNTEKLSVEFNTKPRSGVGISADMFVTPFVNLSGTLASPGVGVNAKGVLLEGGLAVMTGGLSFLYKGALDRATAEVDQCENTLAAVKEAATGDQ